MKVTLRKFLEITGKDFIETYIASLYVDEYDANYGEWTPRQKIELIKDIGELEPYMDYEIYAFSQGVEYEIVRQDIYLRKAIWKLRDFNFNSLITDHICIKEDGATVLDKDRCFEELTIGDTLRAIPIEWADRKIKETHWFFETLVIELEKEN